MEKCKTCVFRTDCKFYGEINELNLAGKKLYRKSNGFISTKIDCSLYDFDERLGEESNEQT